MVDPDGHLVRRIDVAISVTCAVGLGIFVFFLVPRIPGVPWPLWLGLAIFGAISFAAIGLFASWIANRFSSPTSRYHSVFWYTLFILIGIESGIRMAAVIGQVGGACFGIALSAFLIVLEVVHCRSERE